MTNKRRIAIACQGGGSHTAFTAGVLKTILRQVEKDADFEIVALSGTSGGAICAILAWYGLLLKDSQKAIALLDEFWRGNSAATLWDLYFNNSLVWTLRLGSIFPLPEISPYLYPNWGQYQLKQLIEKHIPFQELGKLCSESSPQLHVGAVNIIDGRFQLFKGAEITLDVILASAAIPVLFRAVRIGQEAFWDGLFSQNPPIRDLPDADPDEIWIVQIDPSSRKDEPMSIEDIRERRNELAGNLSLEQEIYFIEKIDRLLQDNLLVENSGYKPIAIKRIVMTRDLDYASKIDRSPSFIQELIADGERSAEMFLNGLKV